MERAGKPHLSPDPLLHQSVNAAREEAEWYHARSEAYAHVEGAYGTTPDSPDYEHSETVRSQRMAEVYESTAQALQQIEQQHRRGLKRAMNPYFKDYSDEQIDEMLREDDKIAEELGAMRSTEQGELNRIAQRTYASWNRENIPPIHNIGDGEGFNR